AGGEQEFALQRPIADLEGHRLRQIALSHSTDYARSFAGRMDQIVDQLVDRLYGLFPEAIDFAERQPLTELSLFTYDAAQAAELTGHFFIQLDDVVEGVGNFTRDSRPIERQTSATAPLLQRHKAGQQAIQF